MFFLFLQPVILKNQVEMPHWTLNLFLAEMHHSHMNCKSENKNFLFRTSRLDYGRCLEKVYKIVQCPCSSRNDLGESPWSALGREIASQAQKADTPLSKICRHLRQFPLGDYAANTNIQERGYKKTFCLRSFQTPTSDLWDER